MTDITANVVVSMPSQLFTMARSFKAVANGKIYIGKIDTDPVNPENQIQVYVENEDGSHVPVTQPIVINAAGYPVYNGQIAKFVTVQGHSMAVYDAYGAQQFYFPNVLKYDPDQLKQELASSWGASLVGVSPSGNVQQTITWVTPKQFGAIGDGTLHFLSEKFSSLAEAQAVYPHATSLSQSIDWAAIQSALNSGSSTIDFRGGVYIANSNLNGTNSVSLIGDANSSVNMTNQSSFTISGSLTTLPKLSANITKTSRSLTFSSDPSIVAGDSILIYNPADYSWSPHRSYYRDGSFFKVYGVAGTSVAIYGTPSDSYSATEMDVYKLNGVRVVVDDLVVNGEPNLNSAPLIIRFGLNVCINNFKGRMSNAYQLELDRCYGVDIYSSLVVNNSPGDDEEYGIAISNCTDVTINGGSYFATRHAIAIGGRDEIGSIPNRNIKIIGATLRNNNPLIGSSDIHGNSDKIQYVNCEIDGGVNIAGRNSSYKGCRIKQRTGSSDGLCIYGSEIVGGLYEIIDCTLETQGDLSAFGAITLSCSQRLKDNLTFNVRNLTVTGGGGSTTGKLVYIFAAKGETKAIDVDIKTVHCDFSSLSSVLYLRSVIDNVTPVVTNGLSVDDVYCPANTFLIYPTGPWMSSVKTREMIQFGSALITSAASKNNIYPDVVNYRYFYSKKPLLSLGISTDDGAAFINPGQPPLPVAYTVSNLGLRPAITAASDFTAGTVVRVSWQVGLSDI